MIKAKEKDRRKQQPENETNYCCLQREILQSFFLCLHLREKNTVKKNQGKKQQQVKRLVKVS
ncbi:hypothetical protein [Enterococcus xiangfangensis]|uniref:hypothetical protein n=1 Tax=Enterococcus xiangfangensis TaxID=1296537 RepID=UPI003D173538